MRLAHKFLINILVVLALALVVPGNRVVLAAGNIYFVDADASGANDGTSWANAFTTLQSALDAAVAGDQIWVAAGIYLPTLELFPGDPRSVSFQMKNGVAIYGGFAGTESDLVERDWVNNETILSGDLNGDDGPDFSNTAENAYSVFNHDSNTVLDHSAILDGFTIRGGKGTMGGGMRNDSNDAPTLTNLTFTANQAYEGGGMYNDFSSPVITNCTFSGNRAADRGGGIYNSGSSPVLINVTFSGNQASMGGGLMNYSSNPTMTGCTFAGNQAGYGGGIANISSYPTLTDCTIAGNSATYEGGGMRNYTSSPVLDNCTFVGNSAGQGGGMYNRYSQQSINDCTFSGNTASMGGGVFTQEGSVIVFTNCTFAGNSAGTGGGIYSYSDSPPVLTNCTFWGNSAQLGGGLYTAKTSYYQPYPGPVVSNSILWANTPDEVAVSDETITPIITFSNVQGGFEGEGNIAADPLFVDTTSADFHLEPDSPCVDSGDNEALHLPEYDYEGDFRILDGDRDWSAIADMGVDELVADAPIPVEVVIDIKPKSLANNLMLSSRGMISVAILTTEAFDASTVDPTTVLFALAAPVRYTMQDVDQDGDLDLLLTFKIQDLILDANSTEASLTGETLEGVPIQGMDMVHIIP